MPGEMSGEMHGIIAAQTDFPLALMHWLKSISATVIKILILVNLLLIFQQIMEEFGWISLINKPLRPLMKLFGLPQSTTLSWVVANLIGLAYGSAIMIDQKEKGKMSSKDADLLNHHVAISHSQLEDPLLFITLGYALHWLIWPRILLAVIAVWLRRAGLKYQSEIRRKVADSLQVKA
jgi:spore maturation protein SpmB